MISTSWVQILLEAVLRNNLGQVVHTYVPLSPTSITWYQTKNGDALMVTCGLTACTPGSAPGQMLGIEYGKAFTYFLSSTYVRLVVLEIFHAQTKKSQTAPKTELYAVQCVR